MGAPPLRERERERQTYRERERDADGGEKLNVGRSVGSERLSAAVVIEDSAGDALSQQSSVSFTPSSSPSFFVRVVVLRGLELSI